jgi:UDP-glucose 4-epimerase
MDLKGKRIVITGGSGLIGSHIADLLTNLGVEEIIILDNFTRGRLENLNTALRRGNVKIIEGDIRDQKLLKEIMKNIDLVFHQAAIRITQCAEEPRLAMEVLVNGTFNVLEAAVNAGAKKVVAASSASVYGLADSFPTKETHHSYHNRTIYGASKAYNEGLLRSFKEMFGLDYVALRYFNVYGPRMDIAGAYTEVFIRWMERISSDRPPIIFGDGSQTMDFVFVEDIARANILAAQSNISDNVFNVASGVETSLKDLATLLIKVMECKMEIEYGPERNVNPVPRRLADTKSAEEKLGFKAEVQLKEGLKKLVDWWKNENSDSETNSG